MPPERFELSTPGLQDQCSNPWAMEASFTLPELSNGTFYNPTKTQLDIILDRNDNLDYFYYINRMHYTDNNF